MTVLGMYEALSIINNTLEMNNIEYVFIEGVANTVHKHFRGREKIELVINSSLYDMNDIVKLLSQEEKIVVYSTESSFIEVGTTTGKDIKNTCLVNIYFYSEEINNLLFEEVLSEEIFIKNYLYSIKYPKLENYIVYKLIRGDILDIDDVNLLISTHNILEDIDMDKLLNLSKEYNVDDLLDKTNFYVYYEDKVKDLSFQEERTYRILWDVTVKKKEKDNLLDRFLSNGEYKKLLYHDHTEGSKSCRICDRT